MAVRLDISKCGASFGEERENIYEPYENPIKIMEGPENEIPT